MPSALVTFSLLDNDDKAMTVEEGRRVLKPLLDYIKRRGLDLSEDINLEDYGGLYDALRTLEREGVIRRYTDGPEDIYWIAENRAHEAAFYRNTLIHHLITRAICEVALVRVAQEEAEDVTNAMWEEVVRLRDVLSTSSSSRALPTSPLTLRTKSTLHTQVGNRKRSTPRRSCPPWPRQSCSLHTARSARS